MQSNIRVDKDVNDQHSGRILSLCLILFQVCISVLYGIFIEHSNQFINITSVILCIVLATLTIAGTLTVIKDLDWSSLTSNAYLGQVWVSLY